MEAKRDLELLENASVKLKITLTEDDVQKEWDSLVQSYCSKVQVKGFRRGKVPSDVLIRKFGDSIKAEAAQNLVERGLTEALPEVEHKPLPYVRPEFRDEIDLELGKPFEFQVYYDTFPQVVLGKYDELSIEEPVVEIGDEDLSRELADIQRRNGMVVDKAEGAVVAKEDTVTIDYVELGEDGTEAEGTRREGFTFAVGSGYNLHKIDDDIIGMKKGEKNVLEKDYPEDFEATDLAGRKIQLQVTLTALKETQLPEIDDELAQDVSEDYKSLDDLRKAITERLEQSRTDQIRTNKIDQLMKQIVDASTIVFPESMVVRDLEFRWQQFVRNMGGNEDFILGMLRQQDRSPEDLVAEWRPDVEETIKRRVAIQEIADKEKVVVEDSDVEEELGRIAESQRREVEDVRAEFEPAGYMDVIREERRLQKAYDGLLETAKVKKGKKVKFLDFVQGNR